jgi:hypothetical protein
MEPWNRQLHTRPTQGAGNLEQAPQAGPSRTDRESRGAEQQDASQAEAE